MLAITLFCTVASLIAVEATPFTARPRDLAGPSTFIAADGQAHIITETASTTTGLPLAPVVSGQDATRIALAQEEEPDRPVITAAPGEPDFSNLNDAGLKFIQTTYYTCVTIGTYTHCGTHRPILDASRASSIGEGHTRLRFAVIGAVVSIGLLLI